MPTITLTAPDGRTVDLTPPSDATPDQIQATVDSVVAQLGSGGGGAPGGPSSDAPLETATTSTPTTTESWTRQVMRPGFQALGGMVGAAAGAPAAAAGPLGVAAPVVGAGLGAGIGGQAYDLFERDVLTPWFNVPPAPPKAPTQMATEAAGDVMRGAGGEIGGQAVAKVLAPVGRGLSAVWHRLVPGATERAVARQASRDATAMALRDAADVGVPLTAGDATGSQTLARLEKAPTYFTLGGGPVTRFREGQVQAAEQAARGIADDVTGGMARDATNVGRAAQGARAAGLERTQSAIEDVAATLSETDADRMLMGDLSQGGVRRAVASWRSQADRLFRDVEQLAGDAPVVPTMRLREAARGILERAQPMGTASPLPPEIMEAVNAEAIPFRAARAIEARLGAAAFGGSNTIGSQAQGEAGALYSALRRDMDDFLTSPSGEEVAPALAAAKQTYATGKQLFNDSAKRLVLGSRRSPLAPEKVLDRAFRPGAITDTLDYKLLVDDATYGAATRTWLSGLVERASRGGDFNPAAFARELGRYSDDHLGVILPPEAARSLRGIAAMTGEPGAMFRELATKAPEAVVGSVFRPGATRDVVAFRSLVQPEDYERAVGAWLDDLRGQATMRDKFLPTRYAAILRKYDRDGTLDAIMEPVGGADRLRSLMSTSGRLSNAEQLAANPSGTGQALTGIGQLGGLYRAGTQAATGDLSGAAVTAAGTLGLPYGLAQFVTSDAGRRLLTQGPLGIPGPELVRGLVQGAAQSDPTLEALRGLATGQ